MDYNYSPEIQALIHKYATQYGIPEDLYAAQIWQESGGQDLVGDDGTSRGVTQISDGSAQDYGIDRSTIEGQIEGGAKIMRDLYNKTGDWYTALRAYNGGLGGTDLPQTKQYADNIMALTGQNGNAGSAPATANYAGSPYDIRSAYNNAGMIAEDPNEKFNSGAMWKAINMATPSSPELSRAQEMRHGANARALSLQYGDIGNALRNQISDADKIWGDAAAGRTVAGNNALQKSAAGQMADQIVNSKNSQNRNIYAGIAELLSGVKFNTANPNMYSAGDVAKANGDLYLNHVKNQRELDKNYQQGLNNIKLAQEAQKAGVQMNANGKVSNSSSSSGSSTSKGKITTKRTSASDVQDKMNEFIGTQADNWNILTDPTQIDEAHRGGRYIDASNAYQTAGFNELLKQLPVNGSTTYNPDIARALLTSIDSAARNQGSWISSFTPYQESFIKDRRQKIADMVGPEIYADLIGGE